MNERSGTPVGGYAMAVAQPGGIEQFHRVDLPPAAPGPGEIALRQTAIGLNFIDVYHRTGLYPWPVERDYVAGSEGVGVIEAVGPGVEDLRVGQRVAYVARGAYASHRVLAAAEAALVPDSVEDEVAAAVLLKGLTVKYLIDHSYPVRSGETVLFHAAAGGVGLIAGQWLAARGVTAIGTAGGAEKCALAARHGFAEVIDYRAGDFVPRVMALTEGRGVPAVYDSVGRDTVAGSLAVLETFGTLVCFGQSSGPPLDFRISDLSARSLRLTRPTLFSHLSRPGWLREAAAELFGLVADGTVRIEIGGRWPLAEVAAAHQALEARQTKGSSVLIP